MKYLITLLFILSSVASHSQKCICTEQQMEEFKSEALHVFTFSNGKQLKICPPQCYTFDKDDNTYFKDFLILKCDEDKPIQYWDNIYCNVILKNDTLLVTETLDLPIGAKRNFIKFIKAKTSYYYKAEELKKSYVLFNIRKYTLSEIKQTLKEYQRALSGKKFNSKNLFNRLLIAALSGNVEAKQHFINFQNNFEDEMSGTDIEDYQNLKSVFTL